MEPEAADIRRLVIPPVLAGESQFVPVAELFAYTSGLRLRAIRLRRMIMMITRITKMIPETIRMVVGFTTGWESAIKAIIVIKAIIETNLS